MNVLFVLLGVLAGLIYAVIGYSASKQDFDPKKFLRTVGIATLTALGLELGGITADIYTSIIGPTALVVWIQKLIDTART